MKLLNSTFKRPAHVRQLAAIRRAARSQLPNLVAIQNDRCFWCRAVIVIVSDIDSDLMIDMGHYEVRWLRGGREVAADIATVDHVLPVWKGGTSVFQNLVAACRRCNEDRGWIHGPSAEAQKTHATIGTNLGELLRAELH